MSYCWSPRGSQVLVPSAGQNRRVPDFGTLDAVTGEITALLTEKKRSDKFLDFLEYLFGHYAHCKQVTLFLDNCSIHHTKCVRDYLHACRVHVQVIWNAEYAPNLNLIERFWGHLKRSAFTNYFFGTLDNLEQAIIHQFNSLNNDPSHPFRISRKTVQDLLHPTKTNSFYLMDEARFGEVLWLIIAVRLFGKGIAGSGIRSCPTSTANTTKFTVATLAF